MSLLDIDRDNADRGTPMPNAKDKLNINQRMAHRTLSTNYQTSQTNKDTTAALQSGLFQLVFTRTVEIINDGSTLTTLIDAHNLGYVPMAIAAMNNTSVTTANGTVDDTSIFLPTWTVADFSGGHVLFQDWLYHIVDEQNIYINYLNGGGAPNNIFITYYLYQQQATG